jgi:hypothetical protein
MNSFVKEEEKKGENLWVLKSIQEETTKFKVWLFSCFFFFFLCFFVSFFEFGAEKYQAQVQLCFLLQKVQTLTRTIALVCVFTPSLPTFNKELVGKGGKKPKL